MPAEGMVITSAEVDTLIVRSTAEVLEKMFFTGIETSGNDGEIVTASPIQVDVHFRGPLTGKLRLRMEEEAARTLGSTLTCLEPEEFSRERCLQLAGEFANVLCGCLLSHLEPDSNLELAPPAESPEDIGIQGGIRRWFCLPEGALAVEFALDPRTGESVP